MRSGLSLPGKANTCYRYVNQLQHGLLVSSGKAAREAAKVVVVSRVPPPVQASPFPTLPLPIQYPVVILYKSCHSLIKSGHDQVLWRISVKPDQHLRCWAVTSTWVSMSCTFILDYRSHFIASGLVPNTTNTFPKYTTYSSQLMTIGGVPPITHWTAETVPFVKYFS